MQTTINAYINFNGKCREAMTFYKECMGGDLNLMVVKDTPMAAQCPAAMHDQIMHSSLMRDGVMLVMGSDMTGPEGYSQGNSVQLSMNCGSEQELRDRFDKLAAGGKVFESPKEMFWGAIFGALTDKYGINWMFNYDKPRN